uniref:Uncharacterized protein n=1 Tax=Vitis vinifera TaxID=29760 RepID=F6HH76_VITVI
MEGIEAKRPSKNPRLSCNKLITSPVGEIANSTGRYHWATKLPDFNFPIKRMDFIGWSWVGVEGGFPKER